jgi:hypothetical protein
MTLDGLTVDEWLLAQAPCAEVARHTVEKAPIAARTPSLVARRAHTILVWCAAVAAGTWSAVSVATRHISCPPRGEGAGWCQLQHHVLSTAMAFLVVTMGVALAAHVVARGMRALTNRSLTVQRPA